MGRTALFSLLSLLYIISACCYRTVKTSSILKRPQLTILNVDRIAQATKLGETFSVEEGEALTSLEWRPYGYDFWEYNGHRVHYVAEGSCDAPPLVLIHGFGASHFHWRFNIPELSKTYQVFALDLLGFGLSDKPLIEYSAEVWRDQTAAFLREVVGVERTGKKAVVAGNSLGGYTALAVSSEHPDLVASCVLLNAAGRFETAEEKELRVLQETQKKGLIDQAKSAAGKALQRGIIFLSFLYTKQPARIRQVLKQVYPVDSTNVDEKLVDSIYFPALHPDAAEVFYRVITKNGGGPTKSINELLAQLSLPLLLLWGEKDPWIRSPFADRIQSLYPNAKRISLDAGHCPHDEVPIEVNRALLSWCASTFKSNA